MEGRLFSQAMATFTNDLLLFECVYVCVCVCVCESVETVENYHRYLTIRLISGAEEVGNIQQCLTVHWRLDIE